jgi:thymidylate kinase
MTAGLLIVEMIDALRAGGIASVYLRNYENLPGTVGNDVDILLPAGRRNAAVDIFRGVALAHGWSYLGCGHFSSLALYFGNIETTETLHIDLFERIEWHFLEFADAKGIIERRLWNGKVDVPHPHDEVYLNVVTRLIYQGKIREKHRLQAREFSAQFGEEALGETFSSHLGVAGHGLARMLTAADWEATSGIRRKLLLLVLKRFGCLRPLRMLAGLGRYGTRIVRKMLSPPGRFLVLEGADGVGKSTVLAALLPWCGAWCAGRDSYDFHWKPVRLSSGPKTQAMPTDPRAKAARSGLLSLLYLAFHLGGFWWGWLRWIYPALVKSHAVVGDRYSYDIYLDPERFRLRLPPALCRVVAMLAPRPEVTLALVAAPAVIRARKPELAMDEISRYQQRWAELSAGRFRMVTVSAEGPPEDVIKRAKQAILKVIANGR